MSSAISGVGGGSAFMMTGIGRMQRPDASQMAEQMLAKVDGSGKGYLEKSDLESAFSKLSTLTGSSSASADEVFSVLDGDSDGKVTQNELTDAFKQLEETLESQFQQMRMGEAMGGMGGPGGMGGMPPPSPPEDDAGFTQEELSAQLEEVSSSDSGRADLIGRLVENFEAADTDGDGRVSFSEARAYDESTRTASAGSSTGSSTSSTAATSASSTEDLQSRVMQQVMKLMAAYQGIGSNESGSAISVTA